MVEGAEADEERGARSGERSELFVGCLSATGSCELWTGCQCRVLVIPVGRPERRLELLGGRRQLHLVVVSTASETQRQLQLDRGLDSATISTACGPTWSIATQEVDRESGLRSMGECAGRKPGSALAALDPTMWH